MILVLSKESTTFREKSRRYLKETVCIYIGTSKKNFRKSRKSKLISVTHFRKCHPDSIIFHRMSYFNPRFLEMLMIIMYRL